MPSSFVLVFKCLKLDMNGCQLVATVKLSDLFCVIFSQNFVLSKVNYDFKRAHIHIVFVSPTNEISIARSCVMVLVSPTSKGQEDKLED